MSAYGKARLVPHAPLSSDVFDDAVNSQDFIEVQSPRPPPPRVELAKTPSNMSSSKKSDGGSDAKSVNKRKREPDEPNDDVDSTPRTFKRRLSMGARQTPPKPESQSDTTGSGIFEEFGSAPPATPTMFRKSSSAGSATLQREVTPNLRRAKSVLSTLEMQESGESQRFKDDVEFIIEGAEATDEKSRNTNLLELLTICKSSDSRLLFRAHGLLPRIVNAASQANREISVVAISLLCVLFQDRLNAEYLTPSVMSNICLMLEAVHVYLQEGSSSLPDTAVLEKVVETLRDMEHVETTLLENATMYLPMHPKSYAVEAILICLTFAMHYQSRVREDLRTYRGLHTLANMVCELVAKPKSKLKKRQPYMHAEACLAVLNFATCDNDENQRVVLEHTAPLISSLLSFLDAHFCHMNVSERAATENCVRGALTVLINLSNENEDGSTAIASHGGLAQGLWALTGGLAGSEGTDSYDTAVLGFGLLINLVERSAKNRDLLRECTVKLEGVTEEALSFVVTQFIGNPAHLEKRFKTDECIVLGAYASLLLGCLLKDNETNQHLIAKLLSPTRNFHTLKQTLESFIRYQEASGVHTEGAHKSFTEVISVLEYYS